MKSTQMFIGRTDAEAEAPVLWPPDAKRLIRKDPDAGKDCRQEEKGTTEDEMVGWHHQLNGLEFEQAPGDSEGEGSSACCSPRGRRVRHDCVTEQQQRVLRIANAAGQLSLRAATKESMCCNEGSRMTQLKSDAAK